MSGQLLWEYVSLRISHGWYDSGVPGHGLVLGSGARSKPDIHTTNCLYFAPVPIHSWV